MFGASDEVSGALESGVDFEKRMNAIYQGCRTPDAINAAFDELHQEMESEINAARQDAPYKAPVEFRSGRAAAVAAPVERDEGATKPVQQTAVR